MTRKLVALLVLLATVAFTPSALAQRTVVIVEGRPPPPRYVRYRVVRRVPPGYHLEERPRTGLIVAGAVLTGIGTALIVGSVVDASNRGRWSNGDEAGAIFGGLFDVIGLPMLLVGATTHRLVLVPNYEVGLSPIVGPKMTGGALTLRF